MQFCHLAKKHLDKFYIEWYNYYILQNHGEIAISYRYQKRNAIMLKKPTPDFITITSNCYVQDYRHSQEKKMHTHSCIEMFYVISGSATHLMKTGNTIERSPLTIGNYMILQSNSTHGFHNVSPDFSVINFLFLPSLIDPSLPAESHFDDIMLCCGITTPDSLPGKEPVNTIFYDENARVQAFFRNALHEFRNETFGSHTMLRCYAIQIITMALRSTIRFHTASKSDPSIHRVCEYVNHSYAKNITLSSICEELQCSMTYMSKKFKNVYGTSFESYLQQIRVHKACELLLNSLHNVNEIASLVGYSDVNAFRKIFIRYTGKTPSDFKKLYYRTPLANN